VPPLLDYVVDVEVVDAGEAGGGPGGEPFAVGTAFDTVFGGDGDAQGSVADDQGGIGVVEHGNRIGVGFEKFGGNLPAAGGEDLDERLRAPGTAVERDAAGLADGHFAEEQEAADALLGSDGEPGEDGEAGNALVFDGGNDSDVDVAGAEGFGALRRYGEGEVVFVAQGTVGETANERGGVEVLHDGDAEFAHVGCANPETQV